MLETGRRVWDRHNAGSRLCVPISVGLDVHKDTIAVAVALPGREEPVYRGEIKNQRKSLVRLIRSLSPHGEVLSFCYEAGPCG